MGRFTAYGDTFVTMPRKPLLSIVLLLIMAFFAAIALTTTSVADLISGFAAIQLQPARLISDFMETAGIGPALLNAALVGLGGLTLIHVNKVALSGPTFAAVLTLMGFALFGKTIANVTPIIFGVFIAAKIARKQFKEYIIIALFGTALAPVISFAAVEAGLSGLWGVFVPLLVGIGVGVILPAAAIAMLHLHQGYNLYNIGLTCGFLALFLASGVKAGGLEFTTLSAWYSGPSPALQLIIPSISLLLISAAILSEPRRFLLSFTSILKLPGRLPSDFMDSASTAGALFNAGLLGLFYAVYIAVIGADLNGPVIGGVLTIVGFGAFGSHLKNSLPIFCGVVLATLFFGHDLSAPGPLLAAIFGLTLAPIAGQFGPWIGVLAGFIHLSLVLQSSAWYGGMNLYNNGFAGGLTATLLVALIEWRKSTRKQLSDNFTYRSLADRKEMTLNLLGEAAGYILDKAPKRMVISLHQEDSGMHLCIVDNNEHTDDEIASMEEMLNSRKRPELAGYYGAMTGHDLLGTSRLDLLGWQIKHADITRTSDGIKIDLWLGGDRFQNSQFTLPS